MTYQPLARITAADADAEPAHARLFPDDEPPALPLDLTRRGWKLIERAPGRMFAVSSSCGCTQTRATLRDVVREARAMMRFCEAMNRKRETE